MIQMFMQDSGSTVSLHCMSERVQEWCLPAQAGEVLLLVVVEQQHGSLTTATGVHLEVLVLQGSGDDLTHPTPAAASLLGLERVLCYDLTQEHDVMAGREAHLSFAWGGGGASDGETYRCVCLCMCV